MTSVPSVTFWVYLADLIQFNPTAAVQFARDCADVLGPGGAAVDYLTAEEELESLVNTPKMGQPTSGDGQGEATTFALVDSARGELIDLVTVTGPGDRLGTAWDEFAERHGVDLRDVNPEVNVLSTYGDVSIVTSQG